MRIRCVNLCAAVVWLLASGACGQPALTVEYRSGHTFSRAERSAIEDVAVGAARDVRELLRGLPAQLRITVQAGARVIPETGETAEVGLPGAVYWTVDPTHDGGVIAVAKAQLRATLFHEFYHLVRETTFTPVTIVDHAINEGLATAFERDLGGAAPPWGAYPNDVAGWAKELLALPGDAPRDRWMFRHSDGRRWVGFKVGTYLADRAVRASGLSLAQLATVPTDDIIAWADHSRAATSTLLPGSTARADHVARRD